MAGHPHTHDDYDWAARLASLRRGDAIRLDAYRAVAQRLVSTVGGAATVVDVGSGSGGMAAQFASALRAHGGGTLVLVDAVPELLDAATEHVHATLRGTSSEVEVRPVLADAADETLPERVPPADLVWAAHVVHHLRDQQEGLRRITRILARGGWLALAEGGLDTRCVPWDLGVGGPGLVDRLIAGRKLWFARMRAEIPESVRLTVGWTRALRAAGLTDVTSFSYLVDHPAPVSDEVRDAVVEWLGFLAEVGTEWLSEDDRGALGRLLDPDDPAYVGARDDLFYLACDTVHLGRSATQ